MHTSGLVLTLADSRSLPDLQAAGPFLLGEANGPFVSAVLEVASADEARHWHEWASGLPGVSGVEVVFVHWDEELEAAHADA